MKYKVYLSLGSNLGERAENLNKALNLLKEENLRIKKLSSIFETEPVGLKEQPYFLNQVIEIETDLSPTALLKITQNIERIMGRKRERRWGPRIIDIDILWFNGWKVRTCDLILPHPEGEKRRFVLEPLQEIAPDLVYKDGKTVKELLSSLKNQEVVRLYKESG